MIETILNYALVFAYVAFTVDVIFQIARIHREKDSIEVSGRGILARLFGSLVLLARFIYIEDIYLIIGQAVLCLSLMVYFGMVLGYRHVKIKI